MKELELKYGCNPNQQPSRIWIERGELPLEVLNGRPGYINFLDALNGWQLVPVLNMSRRPAQPLDCRSTTLCAISISRPTCLSRLWPVPMLVPEELTA